ncbi:hypothetical protein QBC40DRAFT_288994 [Triangularia verruculosa]|uniref:Uncharacterized protein n=1 Tax=Triangularia verruculosa TaxID=2587418 RepID=A0AAN6X7U7_9PEZI|nr:hypothetical protein QBC40DRAFT_288994 [Triangularia verruculosa]
MASKPGIIAVRSRPSPLLTSIVFQKWYEDIHIPDVLGTGHVKSATRYHTSDSSSMPFLAIYQLPDMFWLHEDDCKFWKIPLRSEVLPGDNTSIFDVAEFKTEFFEMIDTVQFGKPADDDSDVASKLLLSSFDLVEDEESGDSSSLHKAALARLGITESKTSESVRSTLFKVDKTRPHHPAMSTPVAAPDEKQCLCMLEYTGDLSLSPHDENNQRVEYTLLRAFK